MNDPITMGKKQRFSPKMTISHYCTACTRKWKESNKSVVVTKETGQGMPVLKGNEERSVQIYRYHTEYDWHKI
jgi:hypothetical protein